MRATITTACLLVAIAACGSKQPAPASDTAADPVVAEPTAPPPTTTEASPLSEEEFKALHQLRTDAPPPARGTTIDLAGSKAYLSLPEGATAPMPGIVVIHEWWGLNDNIRHWADRLASLGYAALAVDLYGGKVATDPDTALATMKKVKPAEAKKILDAAVAFLADDSRIQAPKRAVIGWCFGGAWSLQTALAHPEIDAAVIYYGQLETDPKKLAAIDAEILGIFANKDTHITPASVDAFEKGLAEAKVTATIKRYDADHAFANPSAPVYDQANAAAAWEEVVAFLRRTLG